MLYQGSRPRGCIVAYSAWRCQLFSSIIFRHMSCSAGSPVHISLVHVSLALQHRSVHMLFYGAALAVRSSGSMHRLCINLSLGTFLRQFIVGFFARRYAAKDDCQQVHSFIAVSSNHRSPCSPRSSTRSRCYQPIEAVMHRRSLSRDIIIAAMDVFCLPPSPSPSPSVDDITTVWSQPNQPSHVVRPN